MKLNGNYEKVAAVDDLWLGIPIMMSMDDRRPILELNHTASEFWDCIAAGCTEEQIVEACVLKYHLTQENAEKQVSDFIAMMRKHEIIDD